MKIYEIFGCHLFKARQDEKGKAKAIIIEGLTDEKPKFRVKCPECEKVFYPLVNAEATGSEKGGLVNYRLPQNWPETGNIILMLDCPQCNWVGDGWFTLVEVRP